MRLQAPVLSLLLIAAALAGCADSGDGGAPPQETNGPPLPTAGEGLGVVVGVVVDPTITPVADARVELLNTERETTTDEDGRFAFGDVEPGVQMVRVSKPGYSTVQQSVDVAEGVQNPRLMQVMVEPDPESRPFVMEYHFTGFIECSVIAAAGWVAVCGAPDSVLEELGQDPVMQDTFITTHEIDRTDPMFIQSELVWDATQSTGDMLQLTHSHSDGSGTFTGNFNSAYGTSPVLLQTNQTVIQDPQDTYDAENWNLVIRVAAGGMEGTDLVCDPGAGAWPFIDDCLWGTGATIQQDFEVFTHVFYNMLPEEGWRFTEHGSPPNTV